jgi:hypothetical protein
MATVKTEIFEHVLEISMENHLLNVPLVKTTNKNKIITYVSVILYLSILFH